MKIVRLYDITVGMSVWTVQRYQGPGGNLLCNYIRELERWVNNSGVQNTH